MSYALTTFCGAPFKKAFTFSTAILNSLWRAACVAHAIWGGDMAVARLYQGRTIYRWFLFQHVNACRCYSAVVEGLRQCCFVHQRTSARVYNDGRGFHKGKGAAAYDMPCAVGQRTMQTHYVGISKETLKALRFIYILWQSRALSSCPAE